MSIFSNIFLTIVSFLGQFAANSASVIEFYQPKVPEALKH